MRLPRSPSCMLVSTISFLLFFSLRDFGRMLSERLLQAAPFTPPTMQARLKSALDSLQKTSAGLQFFSFFVFASLGTIISPKEKGTRNSYNFFHSNPIAIEVYCIAILWKTLFLLLCNFCYFFLFFSVRLQFQFMLVQVFRFTFRKKLFMISVFSLLSHSLAIAGLSRDSYALCKNKISADGWRKRRTWSVKTTSI